MDTSRLNVGVFFPETVVALQKELSHHKELTAKVQAEARNIEEALAMICTHCDLIVDGYYDVPDLAAKLIPLLQRKRIVIVQDIPTGLVRPG